MTARLESWESTLLAKAYAPLESWAVDHAPAQSKQPRLDGAYAHCEALTRQHSTTFYLASALLPGDQRRAMRALYAFCRVSDDLVDRPHMGHETPAEVSLERWRRQSLRDDQTPQHPVLSAWADAKVRYNIPQQYAEQLLDGVARDLAVDRYATFSELAGYCYSVASTVGLMSMHIVGYTGTAAVSYAVKLGIALQLTNILRDVAEDWRSGRLYLPLDELTAFGLSEADIEAQINDGRWRAFMAFQVSRARRLYAEARPGLAYLNRGGRSAVAAAAVFYGAILDDIEDHNYDVFSRRAHLNNRRKIAHLPLIARWSLGSG